MFGSIQGFWVFGALTISALMLAWLCRNATVQRDLGYLAIASTIAAMAFAFDVAAWTKFELGRQEPNDIPGTVVRDCAMCPDMAIVGGGEIDIDGIKHRFWPGFAISRREITQADFTTFASATNRRGAQCGPAEVLRAVCVSRGDVEAYASWLSGMTGLQYRLPSPGELTFAAHSKLLIDQIAEQRPGSDGVDQAIGADCTGHCGLSLVADRMESEVGQQAATGFRIWRAIR